MEVGWIQLSAVMVPTGSQNGRMKSAADNSAFLTDVLWTGYACNVWQQAVCICAHRFFDPLGLHLGYIWSENIHWAMWHIKYFVQLDKIWATSCNQTCLHQILGPTVEYEFMNHKPKACLQYDKVTAVDGIIILWNFHRKERIWSKVTGKQSRFRVCFAPTHSAQHGKRIIIRTG